MRRLLILLGALGFAAVSVAVVALIRSGHAGPAGEGWVSAGSVVDLRTAEVLRVPDQSVYVVSNGETPLALSTVNPHLGHNSITYCESSGWFEDVHGEMFDGQGYYKLGPAPRGMDRVAVAVIDGDVWIQPDNIIQGPPRGDGGTSSSSDPAGPYCQ